MEILDLRHIRGHDLEPLLEEQKDLWRRQLLWDHSASADLIRRFVDSRSLPGYAAVEDGRTVGYSFFVYENYKGLIGDLFVTGPFRGDLETQLLAHVIETIRETPGIRRIEAQLMTFATDRLKPAFAQERFRSQARKFMLLEIGAASLPSRAVSDIEFLPWNDGCFEETAALIAEAYRGHVDSEINDQYRSLAGSTRFLRNIMHYPGCGQFHAASSWTAYHRRLRMLLGLILTSVVSPGVGHVTQVCAAPEFQGQGVGYELLRRAAASFCAAGFHGLTLTVTGANTRAVELYQRMGFRTLKEFSAYFWDAALSGAS